MSDNDFNDNHNQGKDPWNHYSESSQPDSKPEDSAESGADKDAPSEGVPTESAPGQEWKDVSSSKPEDSQPVSSQEPTAEQPTAYQPTASQPGENPYQHNGQYQNPQNQGNPQNPYSPYGQNNNPYGQGQYNNPYGNYNNPYGGYGQNQYNQQGQQPYWSYQQYGGQYQQQDPQHQRPPKKKNTGLKIFLWILGILIVGTVTAFGALGAYTTIEQRSGKDVSSSQAQNNNGGDNASSNASSGSSSSQVQIQGGITGNGTNPNSSGIVINSNPGGSEMNAKQVYKKVVESVVGVEVAINDATTGESGESQGTGIIATADGYILTNAHVVNYSRANKVTVVLHNSKQYAATVVGYDKTSDLAVLKINATDLTPAVFGNADQLEVGDQVIAIGNPGGMSFASSLTGGLVSALNRTIETHSDNGMTYIQTDAAINPGNSGGPLVNMYGQVVGINSNKIVATGYEGMGFSIPVSKAKAIIDDLISRGYVTGRSRLGITAIAITEVQAQLSGYPVGVMIREIGSDSDLKSSKVVAGDIITKADGQALTSLDDLYAVLNKHKAGDTITLTIYSPGTSSTTSSTRTVKTKLLEDKGETQAK
jgi:serine protease Do